MSQIYTYAYHLTGNTHTKLASYVIRINQPKRKKSFIKNRKEKNMHKLNVMEISALSNAVHQGQKPNKFQSMMKAGTFRIRNPLYAQWLFGTKNAEDCLKEYEEDSVFDSDITYISEDKWGVKHVFGMLSGTHIRLRNSGKEMYIEVDPERSARAVRDDYPHIAYWEASRGYYRFMGLFSFERTRTYTNGYRRVGTKYNVVNGHVSGGAKEFARKHSLNNWNDAWVDDGSEFGYNPFVLRKDEEKYERLRGEHRDEEAQALLEQCASPQARIEYSKELAACFDELENDDVAFPQSFFDEKD